MTDDEAYAEAHAEVDRPPQWRLTVYWDHAEQRFRTSSVEFDLDFTSTAETEIRFSVLYLLDHLADRLKPDEVLR